MERGKPTKILAHCHLRDSGYFALSNIPPYRVHSCWCCCRYFYSQHYIRSRSCTKRGLIVHSPGSIATGIHSGIGNIAAGSSFAIMQSITVMEFFADASLGFAAVIPALAAFIQGLKKDGCVRRFFLWITGITA